MDQALRRPAQHVDEAGRDRLTACVDNRRRIRTREVADRRNAPAGNAYIRPHTFRPGTVEHGPTADDDIEFV